LLGGLLKRGKSIAKYIELLPHGNRGANVCNMRGRPIGFGKFMMDTAKGIGLNPEILMLCLSLLERTVITPLAESNDFWGITSKSIFTRGLPIPHLIKKVDIYLARGEIEQAEEFIEQKRQYR
jgi:hypothetical protein